MNNIKQADVSNAIQLLLKATKKDTDPISCLVLGEMAGNWKTTQGTVFIVRNADIAEKLFLFLVNQKLSSESSIFGPNVKT